MKPYFVSLALGILVIGHRLAHLTIALRHDDLMTHRVSG